MNSLTEFNIPSHIKSSHSVYINKSKQPSNLKRFIKKQEQLCKTSLKTYNDSLKKDTMQYGDMKQTLKTFLTGYETIQVQKEKAKSQIKLTKFSTPFIDLVTQYVQKGYKIPNLSRHNNLFKPSIILTNNKSNIDKYIKEAKRNKQNLFNNKEYKYMDKLEECVNTKLIESRNNLFTNTTHVKFPSSMSTLHTNIIDNEDTLHPIIEIEDPNIQRKIMKRENKELLKYNKRISNCIKSFEKELEDNNNNKTNKKQYLSSFKKQNTRSSKKHVLFKRSLTKEFNNNNNNIINNSKKQPMNLSKYVSNSIIKMNTMNPHIFISNSNEKITYGNNNNNNNRITLLNKFNKEVPVKLHKQSNSNITSQNGFNTFSTIENESSVTLPFVKNKCVDLKIDCEGNDDPSHFFKVIRFTKRKVLNYNIDTFKTLAKETDKAKNSLNEKHVIDRMITLDKTVDRLDRALVKAIEMCKTI